MPAPLGMESGAITPAQITDGTTACDGSTCYYPYWARLHSSQFGGTGDIWMSKYLTDAYYMQVDMGHTIFIDGV